MSSSLRYAISLSDLPEAPPTTSTTRLGTGPSAASASATAVNGAAQTLQPPPPMMTTSGRVATTTSVPPMPGTNVGLAHWFQQQQQQAETGAAGRGATPAGDSVAAPSRCAVFWDFENCPPPSGMPGYVVVDNIRNVIHHFGNVVLFKAYLEINDSPSSRSMRTLRSELQSSGVSLTDCPHNGRKDAADKMMMVDIMAYAIDNPAPATIVLISGDRDFVYALSTLRNRRYTIVLIVPNKGAPIILKSQANAILEWRYDVLNQDVWNMQQQQVLTDSFIALNGASTPSLTYSSVETSPAAAAAANSSAVSQDQLADDPATWPLPQATTKSPETAKSSAQQTASDAREPSQAAQSLHVLTTAGNTTTRPTILVAPEVEAIRDTERDFVGHCFSPNAPGYFDLLVEVLETFRLAGDVQPRRSKVGNELVRRNPLLYQRAGCSSFKEFVELAVEEQVVDVGGERGLAWMSLKPNHRGKAFRNAAFQQ